MARTRVLRRSPVRSRGLSRRVFLKSILGTAAGALTGTSAYGFLYERHALDVTRETVTLQGLSPALNGLKVGLLTDVHRSRWVSADDVKVGVEALLGESPDLIVLGGDYITASDRRFVGPAAESLSALHAPHGVFAILGNHDDDHDMPEALTAHGIQVLKDARTRLMINGAPLELAGIRYWTRKAADVAAVVRGSTGPLILLAHDPRRLIEAAALNIPLVLSGHTHGGQVVLPGIGAIAQQKFSPAVPVLAGIGRRDETTLFVSRGLGTVYVPMRVNCPPEVAVLTLRAP